MGVEVEVISEVRDAVMYYPYLAMNDDGDIVLFIKDDYGVCLKYSPKGGGCQACWVGDHRPFDRSKFKPMPDGASIRIFNKAKKG
jgi:hypothetical protein